MAILMNEGNLGFKVLSLDNWMLTDPVMRDFAMINNGVLSSMTASDWAASILEPKLTDNVPIEVLKLFEVARGLMLYGYFFYPVYTLALEQLSRVAETSINHKCKEMGHQNSKDTFARKIDWLAKNSAISDKLQWHAIRNIRNEASHPKEQMILPPGVTLNFLVTITESINSLFSYANGP